MKEDINRRGSNTWLLCNDNSRSQIHRNTFIQKYGGNFTRKGTFWIWSENKGTIIILKDPEKIETSKKWIFTDQDGNKHEVENISEFCKQNSLSRPKIYEMIKGERKSHKGFRFISKTGANPA